MGDKPVPPVVMSRSGSVASTALAIPWRSMVFPVLGWALDEFSFPLIPTLFQVAAVSAFLKKYKTALCAQYGVVQRVSSSAFRTARRRFISAAARTARGASADRHHRREIATDDGVGQSPGPGERRPGDVSHNETAGGLA